MHSLEKLRIVIFNLIPAIYAKNIQWTPGSGILLGTGHTAINKKEISDLLSLHSSGRKYNKSVQYVIFWVFCMFKTFIRSPRLYQVAPGVMANPVRSRGHTSWRGLQTPTLKFPAPSTLDRPLNKPEPTAPVLRWSCLPWKLLGVW